MSVLASEMEKDLKVHVKGPKELGEIKCEFLDGMAYIVEPPYFNKKLVTVKFTTGKHKGETMTVPVAICFWTKQDKVRLNYEQLKKKKD